jgi:hypothetical protein
MLYKITGSVIFRILPDYEGWRNCYRLKETAEITTEKWDPE